MILATGVVDNKPDLPSVKHFIYEGKIRFCPICDGYEMIGKSVAVLGPIKEALKKALFLSVYTNRLTILPTDRVFSLSAEERARLQRLEISRRRSPSGTSGSRATISSR